MKTVDDIITTGEIFAQDKGLIGSYTTNQRDPQAIHTE